MFYLNNAEVFTANADRTVTFKIEIISQNRLSLLCYKKSFCN